MMKKLAIVLLTCLLIIPTASAQAAPIEQHIYDYAELLSDSEISTLESEYDSLSSSAGVDIVYISTYDTEGKTDKVYLEDFFDDYYDNKQGILADAALILINMDSRNITIQGYGNCEFYISNDRIEYMLDDIQPHMSSGDYYEALSLFATEVEYYMGEEEGVSTTYKPGQDYGEAYGGPSNYYGHDEETTLFAAIWWMLLIAAFVIGGISILVMIYNAGGKVTVTPNTYLDQTSPGLIGQSDKYIRTTVTKIKHVESSGGRSSGGGGSSSGGHSHSGGSRGF